MSANIEELEKVVSQVEKRISSLLKENASLKSLGKTKGAASDFSNRNAEKIRALEEENLRLLHERKMLRKQVRSIIRRIDKVKW
jgi:hypothetical protein